MNILLPVNSLAEVIYFLAVLQALPPGPHTLLIPSQARFVREHLDTLDVLQKNFVPAVAEIMPYFPEHHAVDLDMQGYPRYRGHHSLLAAQAAYCGVDVNPQRSWIRAQRGSMGRVVVSRSAFKRNSSFPWNKVLDFYSRERLLFIGSSDDHDNFCREFRVDIPVLDPVNILDTVGMINSAKLVVSNSNEVLALAEAMKVPTVVELSLTDPDCVFARPQARYCFAGKVSLPSLKAGGRDTVVEMEEPLDVLEAAAHTPMPECGWRYPAPSGKRDLFFYNMPSAVAGVKLAYGLTTSEVLVEEAIIRHTVSRFPEAFLPTAKGRLFQKVLLAFREAGVRTNGLSDFLTIPRIEPLIL